MKANRARWFALLAVTAVAVPVLIVTSVGIGGPRVNPPEMTGDGPKLNVRVPVAAIDIERSEIEVVETYSGMLRPLERFHLAFDLPGRIDAFGTNRSGAALDEGDTVEAGQVLARLDARVFNAQLREAKANLEQAQSDLNRANELRQGKLQALSVAEHQQAVTGVALASARVDMAEKSVGDATLVSPVAGVISRRLKNAGESADPRQVIMEVIQVDPILLIVGVPESRIAEMSIGQKVRCELLGHDLFHNPSAPLQGQVHRVGQTADDRTGLFEVEIAIANADHHLKPGQVATGGIVTQTISGFRLPVSSAIFRRGEVSLFAIVDEGGRRIARRLVLTHYVEQGPDLIVPELPENIRTIITRGQHRLVDGSEIQIVEQPT